MGGSLTLRGSVISPCRGENSLVPGPGGLGLVGIAMLLDASSPPVVLELVEARVASDVHFLVPGDEVGESSITNRAILVPEGSILW